eukprot:SAG31_NODE_8_length_42345_cov_10.980992_9_plen_417_part_00
MLAATITAALPVAVLGGGHAPPSAACAATLDKYCGDQHNPDLRVCYASMRKNHRTIPLLAGFSGPGSRRWRCYSPDDLEGPDSAAKPLLNRTYSSGIAYCSNSAQLEALLRKCDPGFTPPPPPPPPAGPTGAVPVLVFSGGGIPSLVYVPTPEGVGNGTLIGFSEWSGKCPDASATCTLGSRRSTDLGATWLAATFPADEAVGIPNPGAHSHWCCPQSTYDARTGSVVLQFSNSTSVKGGCDINVEQLGGVLQVRSTDAGKSWFDYRNIQTELEFPKKPLNCLAPTSGQGLVMRPVNGKYGGRLVFCAVRNAYQGDVPVWSDDGGSTYNFSTGLYLPGLDECNIAQAANGSLFLISRNCREGDLNKCQMSDMVSNSGIRGVKSDGTGNHHFVYSISNDGGEMPWKSSSLCTSRHRH